ncbi:FCD domain-containing protein [Undibacterium arcticum]|uniref:FCD domain-containing protein n=1 Tax=Undibacterium arcticum TaxID=1762892 RepID=UPI0036169280
MCPKEHQQIIEALKTRSVQEAVDLMTAHLDEVKNRVIVAAKNAEMPDLTSVFTENF